MRYRFKLALAFVLLALFTGSVVLGVFFLGARHLLFESMRDHVLSIAATAATQIDGDAHRGISSEDDPAYGRISAQLRKIRDANRHGQTPVRFVYTMRPATDGGWEFVVDPEENPADHSMPGEKVEIAANAVPPTLGRAYAEKEFVSDAYGVWLSASAPVLTAEGEPVAMVGVDISASDVLAEMNRFLGIAILSIGVASAAAIGLGIFLALRATRPLAEIQMALRAISSGQWDTRVDIRRKDEFGELGAAVNRMAVSLREREMLKGALVRYVSREVADQILAREGSESLAGRRRDITVCIVDIRNFTALSALLTPEETVAFLNEFFARMIDVVFSHRGTLDKFLGDGFLAIFGAPLDDPDHREMAARAGIAMLAAKDAMREAMLRDHGIDLRIGIAIHSGEAVVGDIGSEQRMEYTAIGDAVNVTSRIEAFNKEYDTEILISGAVEKGLPDSIALRKVATVQPRGIQQQVDLFTIV